MTSWEEVEAHDRDATENNRGSPSIDAGVEVGRGEEAACASLGTALGKVEKVGSATRLCQVVPGEISEHLDVSRSGRRHCVALGLEVWGGAGKECCRRQLWHLR